MSMTPNLPRFCPKCHTTYYGFVCPKCNPKTYIAVKAAELVGKILTKK